MANESAVKDDNSNYGLLVHNETGTETRKLKVTADGALPIQVNGEDLNGSLSVVTKNLDVDESEDQVGTAVDQILTGYILTNRATTERVFKFYEGTVASVTVGTTAPKITIPLGGGQSANIAKMAVKFTGGIVIAATTGVADNDTGAPATNDCVANIMTKVA